MVTLVHVDHRLLHGQVVFTWTKSVDTDCILIASDAVVKDESRMTALRSSRPNGVKLVMESIDDSIEALNTEVIDKCNPMILCKNIGGASRLVFGYDEVTPINLGGIRNEAGERQISKTPSINDEEIESLKKLNDKSIGLGVRMVSDDLKQDVMTLI